MLKTALALLWLVTLLGCQRSPPQNTEQPRTQALQTLVVAYTGQPQSTLVHVALAKGYFTEQGLAVKPSLHTFGKMALQAVIEHQADLATVAETPFMFSVLKGEKLLLLANIEANTTNNAVVARKDAGILTPADLKGKRIGFSPGTTGDFFLASLLTANGLARQQIQLVPLKPEDMQDAIMTKQVDAVSTWNYPLTQIQRQLDANGIVFYDREIYTETFNIAAQQAFVEKNPETVKSFLRALIKAETFVAQNPPEAQAIMAAATQTDITLVRDLWNEFNYRVQLDQTLLITLEDETRWAMKNGLTDQAVMPDYQRYIHSDSLRAIKPEAVKINR